MLSGYQAPILCILSGILSKIFPANLSGIPLKKQKKSIIWHFILLSIRKKVWHPIWHLIWHSIWHLFHPIWSIWHCVSHPIWHPSSPSGILSDILSGISSGILSCSFIRHAITIWHSIWLSNWAISEAQGSPKGYQQMSEGPIAYCTVVQRMMYGNIWQLWGVSLKRKWCTGTGTRWPSKGVYRCLGRSFACLMFVQFLKINGRPLHAFYCRSFCGGSSGVLSDTWSCHSIWHSNWNFVRLSICHSI